MLGYLFAGAAIGPWGLRFVEDVESIMHFSEFGVVLMIGGSIPGATKVASIALYDEVQALAYPQAHVFAATLTKRPAPRNIHPFTSG